MTGVFYVAKLQTATPEMFNFNVSSMLLVMVVLGGMGSVWGVVLGAALLQLLQTVILPNGNDFLQMVGEAIGSDWLAQVDLTQWTQLLFGIILVFMMLFRRDGLIPAVRKQSALTYEAQHAEVRRGGFQGLESLGKSDTEIGVALDIRGRDREVRRSDGAEQGRSHRSRRRRGRGDRTERLRKIDAVQRDHRPDAGQRAAASSSTAPNCWASHRTRSSSRVSRGRSRTSGCSPI